METAAVAQLRDWLAAQLPGATDVEISRLDAVAVGHSAETMLATLTWRQRSEAHRLDIVLRLRPAPPGLLEPYDLQRQFDILRALDATPVRAPRALWHEATGEVLGREFYVMEALEGTVYERSVPNDLAADPERIRTMSYGIVEQLAAIHLVDLRATGLDAIGDGICFLDREFERWSGETRRVQRGRLPALERLLHELRQRQPEQSPTVTLVHGDPKPGNFAFRGDQISGVFDWELATVGDPLADLGWAEYLWTTPGSITSRRGALTPDELVDTYQELTGMPVRHRTWYRAFQGYKMVVIMLLGAMLFDAGFTDDLRFVEMAHAVHPCTVQLLASLGVDEILEAGPVLPRPSRVDAVRERRD